MLAAAITLWATFAPCFLWIFVGAPYVERLGTNPRLASALNAVTAAVVGVILNLSLWFALHRREAETWQHELDHLRETLEMTMPLPKGATTGRYYYGLWLYGWRY